MPELAKSLPAGLVGAILLISSTVFAQAPRPPQSVVSPEVKTGGEVVFRLRAPEAKEVRLDAGDVPGLTPDISRMTRGNDGVWTVTLKNVPAGAYRYAFVVDGLNVVDPENPDSSQSNARIWSLMLVPGAQWFDPGDVAHGAVSEITYTSSVLGRPRRMHVYTPPGYSKSNETFPTLYLLHGASDSDDSWSTVGRAGVILDRLIAAGKAKPMIVVMPDGHTRRFRWGQMGDWDEAMKEFTDEFASDIRPYVESNYRVKTDRANRAIAGLSMGGFQTLQIAAANLADFSAIGVFSSGLFGIDQNPETTAWEQDHAEVLADDKLKSGLNLVWLATGKQDFLVATTRKTVERLRQLGFDVTYQETEGGHTWLNWRDYLVEFVPQLFPN